MAVKIDYKKVDQCLYDIDGAISLLKSRRRYLKQSVSDKLYVVWQGEAASEFKSKLDELIRNLDNTINEMEAIRRDIRVVADNIKKADNSIANQIMSLFKK